MSLRGLVGPKMHEIILLGLQDQPQYAPSYPIPIPSPRRQCFKQTKRMFRLYRSFSRFARLRALRLFNWSFRTATPQDTAFMQYHSTFRTACHGQHRLILNQLLHSYHSARVSFLLFCIFFSFSSHFKIILISYKNIVVKSIK